MRRLIRRLAAAAAATATLSAIPLALAGGASASTIPSVSRSNWAGYAVSSPYKSAADQFGWVQANFTVPKVTCSDSVMSGHKQPNGAPYSAVVFWVGLGGAPGTPLEQDGIQTTCWTKNGPPGYAAFYEMVPADQSGGSSATALYNKAGHRIQVHAGDKIVADTWDYSLASQNTSHAYSPGQVYKFLVTDVTQGAKSRIRLQIFAPGAHALSLGNDTSAEVITESPNAGPWNSPSFLGLAHFQPVTYTSIAVGLNQGGYTLGLGNSGGFTSTRYYVAGGPKPASYHTLISTGGLSYHNVGAGLVGNAFTNTWHRY